MDSERISCQVGERLQAGVEEEEKSRRDEQLERRHSV